MDFVLFVPTHSNSGDPFGTDVYDTFERALASITGGFTRLPTEAVGQWLGGQPPRVYRESHRVYVVTLASIRQIPRALEVVDIAIVSFDQYSVFVHFSGGSEALDAAD